MCSVMAPWIPPPVIEFLQTIAPIASAVASIILAILYFFQFRTLGEQTKISKMSQVPNLTGPYNFSYNPENDVIEMNITNAGDGVAKEIQFGTYLSIPGENNTELEGAMMSSYFSRDDFDFIEDNEMQPGESDIRFIVNPDDIDVRILDYSAGNTAEERTYSFQDGLSVLHYYGADFVQVYTYVKYKDRFGNEEDPFGRRYVIWGPSPSMATRKANIRSALTRSSASRYINRERT